MARIVYLCTHCPFGDAYGAAFRARVAGEGLRLAGQVTMVPVCLTPWSAKALDRAALEYEVTRPVRYVSIPRTVATRFARNLRRSTVNTDDRTISTEDRGMIERLIADADLVWVHTIGVANAVGLWRWERCVLDADDLLSQFHKARAEREDLTGKAKALWQAGLWSRREGTYLQRFDRVVVCSNEDRQYLGGSPRVSVVPNTFDSSGVRVVRNPIGKVRFGFVGTLEYEPNRDAVWWFAREVMPLIKRTIPDAEFRVIGKAGPEVFQRDSLQGTPLGYVEDPTEEMATWTAMVVPVRFGGGTRVKIAEAFARQIPIVSTGLGAFGYDVMSGRELLLADEAQPFANACVSIAQEAGLGERLAAAGERCLRTRYDATQVREQVRAIACDVMGQQRAAEAKSG